MADDTLKALARTNYELAVMALALMAIDDPKRSEQHAYVQQQFDALIAAVRAEQNADLTQQLTILRQRLAFAAQPIGFEACWKDHGASGHCRKPKGHDGDCAPF